MREPVSDSDRPAARKRAGSRRVQRTRAREIAAFVPDCFVLYKRLLADPRVPRRTKVLLAASAGYLALPFDLVPDFIPVLGQLDDALVVAATMAYVTRSSGRELVSELWPGSDAGLRAVLALAPM
jgi:uncharacterized membrane protein YkvA (DUF1232 family)